MVIISFKNQSQFLVLGIIFLNYKLSMNLENEKCYDNLGCVTLTPEWTHPMYRPSNLLPSDRHAVNTIFVLWDLNNSVLLYDIIGTNTLNGTKINKSLKLFIHDFTSNGYTGWIQHLARKTLSSPNSGLTIISVDWAAGAEPPYIQAIANARLVALEIIYFLNKLKITFSLHMADVHIVGHGIGAHIAGYVGKIMPPKRITALDPSGTYFENMPPNVHLSRDDAEYIEVLHTDVTPFGQGNRDFLGHADFFANGGQKQPGCKDAHKYLRNIKRGDLKLGEILKGCSHKRSLKYYIETITDQSCVFLGVACESYKNFLEGLNVKYLLVFPSFGLGYASHGHGQRVTGRVSMAGVTQSKRRENQKGKCTSCGNDMESCLRLNTRNPPRSLGNVLGYYFVTSSSPPFCGEVIKITICIYSNTPEHMYVNGYFNITITQSIGDVHFLINENSIIAALRTNKQHTFLVFRTTPPPLLVPIKAIFLKWQHRPLPCYWCTPPRITKLMIYKLTDISTDKPQWFCANNSTLTHISFGRQLEPCKENTKD